MIARNESLRGDLHEEYYENEYLQCRRLMSLRLMPLLYSGDQHYFKACKAYDDLSVLPNWLEQHGGSNSRCKGGIPFLSSLEKATYCRAIRQSLCRHIIPSCSVEEEEATLARQRKEFGEPSFVGCWWFLILNEGKS